MKKFIEVIYKNALYFAFIQAWAATLGSLYFSEIRHFVPCMLCWYQRILMYPLVILFTVAIYKKDKNIAYYVLPITVLGMVISFYHYLLQMTPLADVTPISCNAYGPCREVQALFLGFVTIPFLAFSAFTTITSLMIILLKYKNVRRK